jgi:hypothetical protein
MRNRRRGSEIGSGRDDEDDDDDDDDDGDDGSEGVPATDPPRRSS